MKTGKFVNRGFLNGPLCPIYGVGVVLVVLLLMPIHQNLVFLYVASTVLVTVLEGFTGFFMDKIFHHKWWDYTDQPLNIGGYVCLPFSLVWGVCCVLIVRVIHPVVGRGISCLLYTSTADFGQYRLSYRRSTAGRPGSGDVRRGRRDHKWPGDHRQHGRSDFR